MNAENITDLQEKSMVNTIWDEVWEWEEPDFLLLTQSARDAEELVFNRFKPNGIDAT